MQKERFLTKQGRPFDKGLLYRILKSRIYVGAAEHKGTAYPGEHHALVDTVIFQRVQEILAGNSRQRAATTRRATPALLKGLIFTDSGRAMTPSHTRKGSRLYRYHVSTDVVRGREKTSAGLERIPAELVEKATITEMLRLIQTPLVIAEAVRLVRAEAPGIDETDIVAALDQFWKLWSCLIPAEQARVIRLLIERVVVKEGGIDITLHIAGLGQIAREMLGKKPDKVAA